MDWKLDLMVVAEVRYSRRGAGMKAEGLAAPSLVHKGPAVVRERPSPRSLFRMSHVAPRTESCLEGAAPAPSGHLASTKRPVS